MVDQCSLDRDRAILKLRCDKANATDKAILKPMLDRTNTNDKAFSGARLHFTLQHRAETQTDGISIYNICHL